MLAAGIALIIGDVILVSLARKKMTDAQASLLALPIFVVGVTLVVLSFAA